MRILERGGEWLSWIKMSVGDCNDENNISPTSKMANKRVSRGSFIILTVSELNNLARKQVQLTDITITS